jgi:hypothetical protein
VPPPPLELDDERHPRFAPQYQHLPADALPCTESLKITVDRVLPFWHDTVCPTILDNKDVIVVAHGNSLRAIVKHLSGMSEEEILKYNIPTAVPLVYEFDQDMVPLKNYYLLDPEEVKRRQDAVANQAAARPNWKSLFDMILKNLFKQIKFNVFISCFYFSYKLLIKKWSKSQNIIIGHNSTQSRKMWTLEKGKWGCGRNLSSTILNQ